MADEVTAEGITQPEAIGRRLLEGLGKLLDDHKKGEMDFTSTYNCIFQMIHVVLPFVDLTTKDVCHEVMDAWMAEAYRRDALTSRSV